MASVKTEPMTIKPDLTIKTDPSLDTDAIMDSIPGVMSDEDVYEDAGDLEFNDFNPATNPNADIYLTHVPKYLHNAWSHLDDDEEIRIGTVRKWTEIGRDGRPIERMALLLDHTKANHQTIPKEYNLEPRDLDLANTFLFTEKDLPGFKSRSHGANSDLPPYLRRRHEQQQQQQQQRPEDKTQSENGVKKNKYQPRYRKAIPKKTALAGKFRREINCLPVWTEETKHLLKMMSDDAMKPKVSTSIVKSFDPSGVIQAGAHVSNDRFSNLVRTAPEQVKKNKKQKEEKSARLPQSELRDRIFECYDRYAYWSLKAFKQTLNQPEAWLRENLEELAVLHKAGRFANYWELKPEYKRLNVQSVEGAPPSPEANDSDFDGDDDNIEMEDVKMDGE
ncbi:transcription initiation factor IIF, beta subunit-domain-containing protein [Xylaria sp. CBS 124048]|nr:transcription initiation factor IIF, beta subunit-domain-containing protein [Xylaria sp. CBS 124048]